MPLQLESTFGLFKERVNSIMSELPEEVQMRCHELIDYNVHGGKMIRGQLVIDLYEALGGSCFERASILGWSVEMIQAFFLIADDIMDEAEIRRGKPCWYRRVGLSAINDAFLFCSLVFEVFKRELPCSMYIAVFKIFNETLFKTQAGQLMDMNLASAKSNPSSHAQFYNTERWMKIAELKTIEYTLILPCRLAIELSGRATDSNSILYIARLLGVLYQMNDDYIDAYGKDTGKTRSDIEEGKCTWLIVCAYGMANEEQKIALSGLYGTSKGRNGVLKIFDELHLQSYYWSRVEGYSSLIVRLIESIADENVAAVFMNLLKRTTMKKVS